MVAVLLPSVEQRLIALHDTMLDYTLNQGLSEWIN